YRRAIGFDANLDPKYVDKVSVTDRSSYGNGATVLDAVLSDGDEFNLQADGYPLATIKLVSHNDSYATLEVAGGPDIVPGDYDFNGVVDDADYQVWREAYGSPIDVGYPPDGNKDGLVDAADYVVWRANYGRTGAAGAAVGSVPEPSDAGAVVVSALCLIVRRRSKSAA
ncbi:MAG TPA: hypothetical protein VHU84_15630, partial [Lacipirellulaceae bacterium]|nr:hypothetical protein [Lacipirellulaceae bacterium]